MAAPNVDEIRKRLAKIKAQAFQASDQSDDQPDSIRKIRLFGQLRCFCISETLCHLLVHIY